MLSFITVFLITYALFSVSAVLFPTDLTYFVSLRKPAWSPQPKIFGIVWSVLYALISLSIAIVYTKTDGFQEVSLAYFLTLIINYFANQAFTFFEFKLKNLRLAFVDTFIVAVTAFLLLYYTIPYSKLAAWLLVPYFLWSCFATLLAWSIYQLNNSRNPTS